MMIDFADSVWRAAEALLPEQADTGLAQKSETPMVICGYTSEFLDDVLLAVIARQDALRPAEILYPAAA